MSKNIFQLEAESIRGFLDRHGYRAYILSDHVVVKDPVLCFGAKCSERTEYKDVVIRDFDGAIRFVEARL